MGWNSVWYSEGDSGWHSAGDSEGVSVWDSVGTMTGILILLRILKESSRILRVPLHFFLNTLVYIAWAAAGLQQPQADVD